MSNPFVAYLNSLHNEQASNQNAIAEMQIQSEYFKRTQVKRELITFLSDRLRDGCFVVLTGHAGDGKTTLLAQVLDELGVSCGSLKKQDTVQGEVSLMYVKDFSELTTEEQDEVLRKCFERQGASLLVANTGPLLAAVKRLAEDAEYMETVMLEAMDAPAGGEISIGGYGDAFVLNIARVDNTDFIRPFLKNIIDDDLWSPCGDCRRRQLCPMYFNRQLLKE
ncbi:MAG: hypothetical protein II341_02385, partial [Oscillospiraceae bacterium]|nr:hypothetical protein [Oscillospiraceae bacterium]